MSIVKLPNAYLARDVYKRLVDPNHFLVKLEEALDWHGLAESLLDLGENDAGGRPRYPAVLMLKMLFVSYLFNHSDRDTEFASTTNILVKYFLGLPIDEKAPDHSSLSRFRDRVLQKKGHLFFLDLFRSLIAQAKDRGIEAGIVQDLDATHTWAKVDVSKKDDPKSPRDPDASWGCKGNETKTTVDGEKVQIPQYFFEYKAHILAETTHNLITGFHVTGGRMADIDGGDDLLHKILTNDERKTIGILAADTGIWLSGLDQPAGKVHRHHDGLRASGYDDQTR